MTYWITDCVPTENDSDADGDVISYTKNYQGNLVFTFRDWDDIRIGQPWLPFIDPRKSEESRFADTSQPPTPCVVERRFVSLAHGDGTLWAVADDGTAWRCPDDESLPWLAVQPLSPR